MDVTGAHEKDPCVIPGVGHELVLGLSTEHTLKPLSIR